MTEVMIEGATAPLDFRLKEAGVAFDGTGFTVGLEISTSAGQAIGSPEPTVAWLDQADGTVRVSGRETLTVGEYSVRYKVADGAGAFDYFPRGEPADMWAVIKKLP